MKFDMTAVNLEKLYQKLIALFISPIEDQYRDFEQLVSTDNKRKVLEKEITALQNKVRNEKQFKKQVELNTLLLTKKKTLKALNS